MKASFASILMLLFHWPGFAQESVALEPTPVHFVIVNAGLPVTGTIGGLQGFLTLDSPQGQLLKVEATLDPGTIETGIALRDSHLQKADYFNTKQYPSLRMTSNRITQGSQGKYAGEFDLTIKDVTKHLAITFTFLSTGGGYCLKGEFTLNRLDFGLGESSMILSDNVRLLVEVRGKP